MSMAVAVGIVSCCLVLASFADSHRETHVRPLSIP